MNQSQCTGCGAMMIWAQSKDGKWIPLDAHPTRLFVVRENKELSGGIECKLVDAFRPHHRTCPKADQFRGSKPR